MAEMVWSFVREHLLPILMEAANMIRGVPKEIAEIEDELESIQEFMNDADRIVEAEEDNTRGGIKTKVKLLREAAFRMEDVIDEYIICEEQQPRDPGCVALPCDPIDFTKAMILRVQIAYKIQGIKSQVREIKERSEKDGFQIQSFLGQAPGSSTGNQNVTLDNLRMAPFYLEEEDVVGFESPKAELIGWLVKGRAERTVISLVGMGGQGKTTLAKKVFDNKEVIGHFDCHAWVTVSQSYTADRLLGDMLQKFCEENKEDPPPDISSMDRDSLIKEVRSYLRQKRYVVLFDDVWSEHFWEEIQFALIDNKNGSRIFITTRDMRVASCCKKTSFVEVHELQSLTPEKSFELFCKSAFRFDLSGCCPEDLMDISFEIVNKCKGLPLAIVAIGGLLSAKDKDAFQWKLFSQNLSLELEKNSHLSPITKILAFSYHDLPYYLKQCFLYFGIYPEDHEVRAKRLFRQWVAEGFVKKEGKKTLEDIAKEYLTELVNRSLVQVSSFTIDGKIRSCRVHDLLRDMILRKCKDLSFCHYISEDGEPELSGIIRRLSIPSFSVYNLNGSLESSDVRSLFIFGDNEGLSEHFARILLTKHKALKILDFEDANFNLEDELLDCIVKNLGDLIHLRYLSFRSQLHLFDLPKAIGKLQNLETLDLTATVVEDLPREISKLKKLRHLLLSDDTSLIQLKDCIGLMTSLQTLKEVNADGGGAQLIRELGKLWQLRKLGLNGVREEHGRDLCSSINEMQYLEKLYIEAADVIDLHFISSPPPMLRVLRLVGKLNEMPEWVPKLQNLVKLTLNYSRLTDDPFKSLQSMPNLLFLKVCKDAYKGESLHFQDGGFQKLKELHLEQLRNLNSIFIHEGALHSLKELQLDKIPQLKTVPSGIQYLKKLEVLDIYYMSTEFDQSIAADGSEEHPILKHVPLVRTHIYISGEGYKTHIIQHSRS